MKAVLCIGSNVPRGSENVSSAIRRLSGGVLGCVRSSGCYVTRPLSGVGSDYVNAVMVGETSLSLAELEGICKEMERDFGRDDEARAAKRVPLDLDVVMADEEVLRPFDYGCEYFQTGYRLVMH